MPAGTRAMMGGADMSDRHKSTFGCGPTSPELLALIERARKHVMTPAEKRAQILSFLRGQTGLTTEEILRVKPELAE